MKPTIPACDFTTASVIARVSSSTGSYSPEMQVAAVLMTCPTRRWPGEVTTGDWRRAAPRYFDLFPLFIEQLQFRDPLPPWHPSSPRGLSLRTPDVGGRQDGPSM